MTIPITTIRHIATALLLMLLLAPTAAVKAQQPVPSEYEESWADVTVPGFTHKEMTVYLRDDSLVYLPLGNVLGILRSRVELLRNGSLYLGHLSNDQDFSINIVDKTLITQRDNNLRDTVALDPTLYFQTDIDLYVRDTLLAAALGTDVSYSLEELKVTIAVSNRLPVVNYIGRKSLWANLRSVNDSVTTNQLDYTFKRSLFGGASLKWESHGLLSRSESQASIRQQFGGSLGLNTPLLYGQFSISGYLENGSVGGQGSSLAYGMSSWNWAFTIPEFPVVSEINLFGRTFTKSVGIRMTNAEMGFKPNTIVDTIVGSARPFDIVELQTEVGIIGATQADSTGEYRFVIPRSPGRATYRTTAINQYEEKIYDQFTYGNQLINTRPGTFEYTVTGVMDSLTPASPATGQAVVRLGVTNWLELGATALANTRSLNTISSGNDSSIIISGLAYSLRAALFHDLGVDLNYEQIQDRGGIGLNLGFIPVLPLSIGVQNIRPRHKDSIFSDLGITVSTGYSGPMFSTYIGTNYAQRNIDGRVGLGLFLGPVAFSSDASMSVPLRDGTESAEIQRQSSRRPLIPNKLNLLEVENTVTFAFKGLPTTQLIALYDHGIGKLASIEAITAFDLAADISVTASLRVPQQDLSKIIGRVGVSWATGPITGRSGLVANQTFQQVTTSVGGTAYIGEAGFELSRDRNRMGSQIRLLAFNDRNGNGTQDDGEEDLRNPMGILIRDIVGDAASQPSDEHGVFRSVPEYEDIILEVDRWSLADEEFYPGTREFGVYMAQGFQRVINVPFQRGYIVEGTAVIERSGEGGAKARTSVGLNSLRIWLESRRGIGVYEGEMFDDGTVLVMGVPVGEYVIRMDQAQLAYRRIMLQDKELSVVIAEDQHQLPEVILVPITSTEASPTQERDE